MALKGLKVLELAGLAPAPYCGQLLTQFGADVVRVDRVGGQVQDPAGLGIGKRSIALDLKSKDGIETFLALVEKADVLIEPFRPGVLEKMGLDPQTVLLERNPRLIVGRLTGYGQKGKYAKAAGHDINYIAISGALSLFSRGPEDPPVPPINLLGDFAGGGMLCAMGILLALYERSTSGKGQIVDSAMVDGAAHLATFIFRMRAAGVWSDVRGTNVLDTGAPFYDTFPCAHKSGFLSVGAIEPQFYALLLQGLGIDEPVGHQMDRKTWPALKAQIAARILTKTRDEWAEVFHPSGPYRDACVAPVVNLGEARAFNSDRDVIHLGTKNELDLTPNPAPRLSRTPGVLNTTLPKDGQHTAEVLKEYGVSASLVKQSVSKL